MLLLLSVITLGLLACSKAEVTIYGQVPLGQARASTSTAADPATTTNAAYNNTVLDPPPVPNPAPAMQFQLELPQTSDQFVGLSIPHADGSFFGFSIELSVVNQILGKNSSFLQVPFLNLMSNIIERAGSMGLRCGGNTQERAELVEPQQIPDGRSLAKQLIDNNQATTETPFVVYDVDFFYMMANVSSLLNVGWYLGIPFNDSVNWRLQIAQNAEQILGDRLLGLQAGNEPDFYLGNGIRTGTYSEFDYFGEVGQLIQTIANDASLPVKNNLIAPSIAGAVDSDNLWTPQRVWDTGFLDAYQDSLRYIAFEHYPDNNCAAQFGGDFSQKPPQLIFPNYLNHTSGQLLAQPYLDSSALAVSRNKPLIMMETNTASCGGFPGISDSFGATLWALDYGLQLAYSNFTHAMLHVGGQNNFYNPFTAPPTNQSSFNEWTVGAVYYSVLVAAEVFGKSSTSQIFDIQGNDGSIYQPQYAVYENGQLAKVALFNYITDPSGASTYTATVHFSSGTVPQQVSVKYLLSDSVSTKDNITWAGQTFGTQLKVDGRLKGDLRVDTVNCDQGANTCSISVPAPGFALVFFSDDTLSEVNPTAVQTFPTTAQTKTRNTVTIDPSVLATSNGHSGLDRVEEGSTSPQSSAADQRRALTASVLGAVLLGALTVLVR